MGKLRVWKDLPEADSIDNTDVIDYKMFRFFRLMQGLTVKEVATDLGVKRQTVYSWENGDSKPSDDSLHALGRIYRQPPVVFTKAYSDKIVDLFKETIGTILLRKMFEWIDSDNTAQNKLALQAIDILYKNGFSADVDEYSDATTVGKHNELDRSM